MSKLELDLEEEKVFHLVEFEDEKDDFSEISIKTIHVMKYEELAKRDSKEISGVLKENKEN